MKKHAVTLFLLLVALALYAVGAALPATVFMVLGACVEAAFWLRIFRGGRRESDT